MLHAATLMLHQVSDNAQLSRLFQEKEDRIEELERQLSRLEEDSTDRGKLLEGIQGDKATISRALAQNKELKLQLEELQSAYVKMVRNVCASKLETVGSSPARVT